MWRRYSIPLFLLLLLVLGGLFTLVWNPWETRPSGLVGAQSSTQLQCEAFCSDTRVGVSVVEVTFSGTTDSLGQLALEVTIYKDGFARNRLARITPIRTGQRFTIIQPEGQRQSTPGFDRLTLTQVRVQNDRGLVTARVEGLDAGLNYFWRVRPAEGTGQGTETAVCRAAICPVDSEPQATPNPPR
jgi:hypothetical protein